MDVVTLSRLQFALTIMFHYLFPPLTIGMGVVLVYLEGMFLRTRQPVYESAARFWTGIFAVTFAVGVATGIVMEFQFGTNWAAYSRFVGDVFGAALAAEGIFAFFLESGFLAILVFGWDRVGPRFHFGATVAVALGSVFSAIWIIVANSWQQTPAGHAVVPVVVDGVPWIVGGEPVLRAEMVDFLGVLLNPSTLDRLAHTLIGAFILGAFFIMSISAWYLLKDRHLDFARRSFTGALLFATVFSLLQLVSGHQSAVLVAEHQPAKLAAMEAHFETGPGAVSLFGIPDTAARTVHASLAVPGSLGLLLAGDPDTIILGLDRVPRAWWPPVGLTFASFHVMVALGFLFVGLTLLASWLRWRGRLFQQRWLLWIFVGIIPLPFVANEVGWATAEVGRQPWSVHPPVVRDADGGFLLADGQLQYLLEHGLLTRDAVSEAVTSEQVLGSILMFSLVYGFLFLVWVYVLDHKIKAGPAPSGPPRPGGVRETVTDRPAHAGSLSEADDVAPERG